MSRPKHSVLSSISFLVLLFSLVPQSLCWGSLGHRTVAYLAQLYLTPTAVRYTTSLLNSEDISEASLWPDKVRKTHQFSFTAGWHYIDAQDDPPRQCGVNIKRDCALKSGCIVSAIVNQTARIRRAETSRADKGEALRFLLHFFGDIHQPLHTEAEGKGGNEIEVKFGKKKTNLHAIWDTDILEKLAGNGKGEEEEMAFASAWAERLYKLDNHHSGSLAAECQNLDQALDCSLSHADEANQWVCDYILKDDVEGVEGKDLSEEYYDGAVPVVELLVGKAGRRLAAWVNALAATALKSDFDVVSLGEEMPLSQEDL